LVGCELWPPSQRQKASDPSMGAVVEAATEFEFQTHGRSWATGRGKTTSDVTRAGDVALPSAVGTTCVAQMMKD
jgi:hypothetical protein